MRTLLRTAAILFMMATLSACAVGNKHAYHDTIADLSANGKLGVAISTHDQRDYITARQKNPHFVGLQRGGYGNPFNVTTASGKALANDMTESLIKSLSRNGYQAVPVIVSQTDEHQVVIDKLTAAGSERLLLLTLNEWKSDTFQNTKLMYDITVAIYDSSAQMLASNSIKGSEHLGGSFMNPPAHAKAAIPESFKAKLEELLNTPEIIAALR